MEIGNKKTFIMDPFAARHALHPGGSGKTEKFGEALENAGRAGQGEKEPDNTKDSGPEALEEKDYRAILQEKMAEMCANIRKGTIQPKFQIGSEAYTQEEWKKLLEKIDAAEEDIQEQVAEEIAAAKEETEAKEGETDTLIITRADGSRIMMVKTPFGEMSIELTKPDNSVGLEEMISKINPDNFQEINNISKNG